MAESLWRSANVDETLAERIASNHHLPRRIAKWLCMRQVPENQLEHWLSPDQAEWISPDTFWDMGLAVERLLQAIHHQEFICIVGDYDVDGVTASTILASTLEVLGCDYACLIPHRVHDGYGLSESLVDEAIARGCRLLVTVDNGIRAHEAIAYAASCGIEVILTDHHEPAEVPPAPVVANLHWTRADSEAVRVLSGAGVAWKFASAVLDTVDTDTKDIGALRQWHLGLAALGALADVMPMQVENRKLVKTGLQYLKSCNKSGWRALCDAAKVDAANLTETTVLWSITPRLNAAGRMDSARLAFDLLMATNLGTAQTLALQLEALNQQRRKETQQAYDEAYGMHLAQDPTGIHSIVVVAGPWHLGVAGIVAAKLVTAFQRPAIVLADDESGLLRGSGRAPDGFSLHESLSTCEEWFVHFGGHESAIGCAVEKDKLDGFREAACQACVQGDEGTPEVWKQPIADDFLPLSEISTELYEWIEKMAPHGPDNPPLTFYVGPLQLIGTQSMSGGKHLRLRVREGNSENELVWFNAAKSAHTWAPESWIAAVVSLEQNTWRNRTRIQLRVNDAQLLVNPLLRNEFGYLYRLLQAHRKLTLQETVEALPGRTVEEAKVMADTFVELGFAVGTESAYHVVEQVVPKDLRHSKYYQSHLRQVTYGYRAQE